MKKIEAVCYCYNYSDFLSETLPENKGQFDNFIIVTGHDDEKTIELCDLLRVKCIILDLQKEKPEHRKQISINAGLSDLRYKDWVVNIDADIWLPPRTRQLLDKKNLDSTSIYGIDRLMCNSYEDWIKFRKRPKIHEGWIYMHLDAFPMGVRNVEYEKEGYIPIGFFQMWNVEGSKISNYPDSHLKKSHWTERADTVHAKKWPVEKRAFIPEVVAIHLNSSNTGAMGENWDNGRKTPYFGIK